MSDVGEVMLGAAGVKLAGRLAAHVAAELTATGPPTVRAMLLRRGIGLGTEQRKALNAGRAVVLPSTWLASHFREGQHPAFPGSWDEAPAWRLERDGRTMSPVGA